MFLMLAKSIMYICHVFPPILSALVHLALIALYAVSVAYQAGSDTSDPQHPQHGPPWYITKSCSAVHDPSIVGYCTQAKAAFACTLVMMCVFITYFGFVVWSCFPSKSHQAEYAEKRRIREERYGNLDKEYDMVPPTPFTPGMPRVPQAENQFTPATPRTLAFNRLGGMSDLPRKHFSSPKPPQSPPTVSHASKSPEIPRSSVMSKSEQATTTVDEEKSQPQAGVYFPPPPKPIEKK